MTHTPEELERAHAVWLKVDDARFFQDEVVVIAQAIREAEDAALDKAITCVRDNFVNDEGHYAIEAIASLKHKD